MNRAKRGLPEEERRAADVIELCLTELAKLEQSFRERARAAVVQQDEARRAGRLSARSLWCGVSEGYRMAAGDVAALYVKIEDVAERR